MLVLTGGRFDFVASLDGRVIANVWRSDIGEWTVDTVDGPYFHVGSHDIAISKVKALTGADELEDERA